MMTDYLSFRCSPLMLRAGLALLLGSCAPGQPLEGGLEPPPDDVVGVTVFPDSVSLNTGEFVDFSAIADLNGGGHSAVTVDWEATGGTISTTGRYTAGSLSGTYTVKGRHRSGKVDSGTVVIRPSSSPPTLTGISVSPSTAALLPGATQVFSAVGVMSDGSNSSVSVTWSATGGSITPSGSYTAPSVAGTSLVIALQQGGTLADTAQVTVSVPPPTLTGVLLTPGSTSLEFGQTQQFTAVGQLNDGTTTTIPITWTATGGTVNASGLFTAGSTAGSFRVIARSANGLADTSAVTVTAPTIASIALTPPTVSLQSGQVQQFTATATLSNGGSQTNPALTWTATGGAVNSSGLYTAGATAGTFRVIAASSNGKADTSAITVTTPTITALSVTPVSVSLTTGQTQQFSVSATLSNGLTQSNPTVTWSATGGTVSTGGLYTAGASAGTFRVIATASNGVADTSAVTLTAVTVTGIVVSPASVSLALGQTQQFTVSATLSNGGSQSNPAVTWSATGGTISGAGLYTAGNTTGTFRVIAVQQSGTLADTSSVTLVVAPPSSMYFNSSEAGCGTDANVILCDDFEDGAWYEKNCDQANGSGGLLQTDGWCGTIYNDGGLAGGTGRCGSAGFKSNCAATTGNKGSAGTSNTTGNMADHGLSQGSAEVWVRFYTKPLPGYQFGQEKWLTFNADQPGSGGIRWGNLMWNCGGNAGSTGTLSMHFNPPMDICQKQNMGNNIDFVAGNWYFAEVHYRLNTPGQADGLFELWVDNCGPNGTSCPATPTLRLRRSDVQTDRANTSEMIRVLWFEAWSEPFSVGERYLDQIKVSKVGPIGFMP